MSIFFKNLTLNFLSNLKSAAPLAWSVRKSLSDFTMSNYKKMLTVFSLVAQFVAISILLLLVAFIFSFFGCPLTDLVPTVQAMVETSAELGLGNESALGGSSASEFPQAQSHDLNSVLGDDSTKQYPLYQDHDLDDILGEPKQLPPGQGHVHDKAAPLLQSLGHVHDSTSSGGRPSNLVILTAKTSLSDIIRQATARHSIRQSCVTKRVPLKPHFSTFWHKGIPRFRKGDF